jgi:3-phosphoshikimate 1-carboxyvinyltransferase
MSLALFEDAFAHALFAEPAEVTRLATDVLDRMAGRAGHIMNLGHGILPETPIASVEALVAAVHATAGRHAVARNFREFSDTFLTLAAIAPLLDGPTKISGITHTRKQETDRVAGMARELTKLGQHVIETEDSLEIHPQPLRAGQVITTYHDHRFAMSFGILGCHDLHGDGRPWLSIQDPACCAKTFPHFFELLESVRQKSLAT